MATPLADPLSQARPTHQIDCSGRVFSVGEITGHHLEAPDVDHQTEVQPDPADGGGQVGDVQAQNLVWPSSPEPWHWARLLWWPNSTPPVKLPWVCNTR